MRQQAAERRAQAWELIKAGYSYERIGQHFGISHQQAFRDVKRTLADLNKVALASAEQYRASSWLGSSN